MILSVLSNIDAFTKLRAPSVILKLLP